jgi:hypothetical protein
VSKATEIVMGSRVVFDNGDTDPEEGFVNGKPWVLFDGVNAVARVPVFVPKGNRCLDVAGANIMRVSPPSEVVERVNAYGYSERV